MIDDRMETRNMYCKLLKRNNLFLIVIIMIIYLSLLSCEMNNDENVRDNLHEESNKVKDEVEENETSVSVNNTIDEEGEIESKLESEENNKQYGYDERINKLISEATVGDIDAMNTLAYYYFNGFGVEQDYEKSLELSIRSAEGGNLASMFNVGYNYYHGFTSDVNYELAIEWYQKAADEMFPKALNALGHMYYEGLGVEQDIDKAVEYTLQSAGFLHNYSLSNMGAIIDEKGLDDDANYWYRLSSKNYMIQSGSTNILYDNLVNGDVDIEVEYLIESESIPEELIEDILFKFYSGTLYDYLEKSSKEYKDFKLDDYYMDEETRRNVSPGWWYDSIYLADINNDGINEIISYIMEGTGGGVSFRILRNIDNEYKADQRYSSYPLMAGINGLITFGNEKYFIVANVDIGNRVIYEVNIYSFDDYLLADSITIEIGEIDTHVIKTYQLSNENDALVDMVEKRIDGMFVEKYDSLFYDNVNETMILDVDIDNDGDVEHYEYESIFYGTINNPISLELRTGLISEKDLNIIQEVLSFNDLAIPIGLEVFNLDGVNYVGVLSYELGTNNHCLTTFKLGNDKLIVIANHLITYNEKFIIR